MKPAWLTPLMLRNFEKMKFTGLVILVLALIPWLAGDFIASLAATQMTTHTTLRTMFEEDDARLTHAFQSARRNTHVEATLVTDQHSDRQPRDAVLTIAAGSKREALDGLRTTVAAMKTAFVEEGGAELFDVGNTPRALPVPSERTIFASRACNWGALLILFGGLALMANRLRSSRLPPVAMVAVVGGLSSAALLFFGGPFVWLLLLPVLLVVLMTVVTLRVRRAEKWTEGRARVVKSKVMVKRHQFSGEETKVTNTASVAYDFSVGSQSFHGNRISIGFASSDRVDETLKRYPEGSTVPVFYDPENPKDCVLERKPPASLGCLWGGAVVVILIYGAVLVSIGKSSGIVAGLHAAIPRVHHPVFATVAGLFGLFCIGSWLWNRRHVRKAFPWLVTKGRIVSSKTESYVASTGGQSHSGSRYFHALIEFAYTVDGQEYHNTVGEPGTTRAAAAEEVARYPAGTELDVHYDPENPTSSALEIDGDMVLDGRASLAVGIVSLAAAIFAALHG